MIYAIQAVGTDFVKYGFAKNVATRMYHHQTSCPLELVILATADWHNRAENRIHNLLRYQCVRGEWFIHKGLSIQIVDMMLRDAVEAELFAMRITQSDRTRARLSAVIDFTSKPRYE